MLNDAYFGEASVSSLLEVKAAAGTDDLGVAKRRLLLTEGRKLLPDGVISVLAGLSAGEEILVQQDDGDDSFYWSSEARNFLENDIVKQFERPTGAFSIVPSGHRWLLHTRDDEPWIYIVMAEDAADALVESNTEIMARVNFGFPYC